jgi:protein involved in ribonucleotide reduction
LIVVYDSLTGNTKKAAEKLGMKTKKINSYENDDDEKVFRS